MAELTEVYISDPGNLNSLRVLRKGPIVTAITPIQCGVVVEICLEHHNPMTSLIHCYGPSENFPDGVYELCRYIGGQELNEYMEDSNVFPRITRCYGQTLEIRSALCDLFDSQHQYYPCLLMALYNNDGSFNGLARSLGITEGMARDWYHRSLELVDDWIQKIGPRSDSLESVLQARACFSM
jgi:hypothetical protein